MTSASVFLLLASGIFVTGLLIYESKRFSIGYIHYFKNLFAEFGISRTLMGIFGIIVTILYVYLFVAASLFSTRFWQAIYFLVFCSAIFVEYSSMKGYGRFTVPSDYLSAYYSDHGIWADSIKNYFDLKSILVVLCYGLLLLLSQPMKGGNWQLFVFVIMVSALINLAMANYIKEGTFPTLSVSAFLRTIFLLPRLSKGLLPRQSLEFTSDKQPALNIVLIVDESIRADHLSLNAYERSTTKYLGDLHSSGLLYNYQSILANANSSLPSNGIILTGARKSDREGMNRLPSIFQYARCMNYKTLLFDGWGPNFWLGKAGDLKYINQWQNIRNFWKTPVFGVDHEIAIRINEIIKQSVGNFIWVNKRGAHFDYNNNYPANSAVWQPVWQSSDRLDKLDESARERLINSYDNAIVYNIDDFFRTIVAGVDLNSSVMIYTSDHGQTLGDDGVFSTHARQVKGVMEVPFFVVSGKEFHLKKIASPSHENIFPTLLSVMGVPKDHWASAYSDSLLQ